MLFTFSLSFKKLQHSIELEIVITAYCLARACSTSSLSSGSPMQFRQFGLLSQKLTALPWQPWAINRTDLADLGICQMISDPFMYSTVGENCTTCLTLFHVSSKDGEEREFPPFGDHNTNMIAGAKTRVIIPNTSRCQLCNLCQDMSCLLICLNITNRTTIS